MGRSDSDGENSARLRGQLVIATLCGRGCAGAGSYDVSSQLCIYSTGNLQSTMEQGLFTPWKLANTINQSFSSQRASC